MNYYTQIREYDYVSFDLFDTLIFRAFSDYTGIFRYMEYVYNKTHTEAVLKYFARRRVMGERAARKKKNWNEVDLDEIYLELHYPDQLKTELKSLEIRAEIENCIPNREMVKLIRRCGEEGKTVIITTDMYLPRRCIEDILQKCRIPYDFLFLSGERKRTKAEGGLFDTVLREMDIAPDRLIHIGDNRRSDFEQPRNKGIHAIQYIRRRHEFPYLIKNTGNDLFIDYFNSLILNGYSPHDAYPDEYKIGYTVMGPAVTEFCIWAHQMKEVLGLDKLLFLSREGYAVRQCYEILYPDDKGVISYARLNKNILRLPGQDDLIKDYLNSFGLEGKRIGLINNSYSGNGQRLLQDFIGRQKMDCRIWGLQFAGNKRCKKILGEWYRTWIPDGKKGSLLAYLFERGSLFFEHLLFEPNGTPLYLERDEDGRTQVICEQPRSEAEDFARIYAAQEGIMDFAAIYKGSIRESIGYQAIRYFVNLVQNPQKNDALSLGSINDDDTGGDRKIIDFKAPFHLSMLYKNDIYEAVSWLQGYMKGRELPDIFRRIFNIRLRITNCLHNVNG